jgi:hypothetical protein
MYNMFNLRLAPTVWSEPKISVFAFQNRECPRSDIVIGRTFFSDPANGVTRFPNTKRPLC